MRNYLISLMAASLLVPTAALAEDGGFLRAMRNQAQRSSQNDSSSDDRSSRSPSVQRTERSNRDRPAQVERAPRNERDRGVERIRRVERVDDGSGGTRQVERIRPTERVQRVERIRRGYLEAQRAEQVQVTEPVQRTQRPLSRYEGLAGEFSPAGRDTAGGRDDRDGNRDWRRDRDGDRDWRRDRDGDRDGDRDWRRDRDGRYGWSHHWRRDRRYDWSSYRNSYRTLFRLGRYHDPYGWGYRRFSIGFNLWPSYYGSSFWLSDPWTYRLPPAYGPYRWIRYYDDALLVNIHTGQVVDVVHNVFW